MVTVQQAFELALQHHQAGRLAEAEALYRQILTVQPKHAEALHFLGVVAHQFSRHDLAVELIRQAIVLDPNNPAAHSNLGEAYRTLGRLDESIASHRQALQLKPDYARAHNNLGVVLTQQGRLSEAIAELRHALQLRPDFAEAHSHLGIALAKQGKLDEAIAAYRHALQLKPDLVEAHSNLGVALAGRDQLDEAIDAYRAALQLKPDYPEGQNNLGNALRDRGQLDEAVATYHSALKLRPNYPDAYYNLGNAFRERGQLDESVAALRRAVQLRPEYAGAHSNLIFGLHLHPSYDHKMIAEEHCRWHWQFAEPLRKFQMPCVNDRNPERRLRVGYVSPDFRGHVIRHFLTPLLEAHDHARFEIHCYASVKRPDEVTERMKRTADVWLDVLGLRDDELAERIRGDRIDILVDLSLHTADNRLLVFARKPAPVQVAWLGYPASTGLSAMDYRITDVLMEPEGSAWSQSVETPVRLPDSWCCFDPIDEYPEPSGLPALRTGHVTFGSLNNFCKVNDSVLRLWAELLRTVEGSRLLLQCPAGETQMRVRQSFEAQGIASHRLELVTRTATREEFLRLFERIDLALDPFPYNGGTTTCEALWMGVPVVSLAGETSVSRAGLSALTNLGLPELVAFSGDSYVKIATQLAHDLPRLAKLRRTLRSRMEASVLMDGPRFARNIEAAYRAMWRRWCAESVC